MVMSEVVISGNKKTVYLREMGIKVLLDLNDNILLVTRLNSNEILSVAKLGQSFFKALAQKLDK